MIKAANVFINIQLAIVIALTLPCLALYLLGIRPYAVMSASMEPAIPCGSLALIDTSKAQQQPEEDDIIAFTTNNGQTVVTHRVIEVEANDRSCVTKGDANQSKDIAAVPFASIIGKCVSCLPYAGSLATEHRNEAILLIGTLIAIDATVLLGCRLPQKTIREKRKESS